MHEQLALAGGLVTGAQVMGFAAQPPDMFGQPSPFGEPGVHGVPRAREWDTVATVEVAGIKGDAVHFVALPDGSLVVEEDEPDGSLAPLADAVEEEIAAPYRAEAVRREGNLWAVAARRVQVAELPGLAGDELELTVRGQERSLRLDGERVFGLVPSLERLIQSDSVVRGERIDGDLWEIRVDAL